VISFNAATCSLGSVTVMRVVPDTRRTYHDMRDGSNQPGRFRWGRP
jgi:hypothetical protein